MSIVNIVKEPEYYYPARMAEQDGLMTYQESQKLDNIPTPSNIVTKSSTAGLLKNDGTVDSNSYVKKSDIETEKTATGNPITLTDAIAGNAIEVSAEIVASQDLHGYDKPWVGGAGKNKLPYTLTSIKSANTGGTWSGNAYTLNGVTFTVNTDSDGNVTSISANGTATDRTDFTIMPNTASAITAGNYVLNGCASGGGYSTYRLQLWDNTTTSASQSDIGNGVNVTIPATTDTISVKINIFNGQVINNLVFKPMLRLSTVSDSTFAPYSNICPITGYSSVVITDVDSESHTATVTVALGSTVYGGTLDLTSGVLTITHANIASYNGETIGEPWISSMDEYTEGGTPTTGAQVVYTLATPTTTTLTAEQLVLVKGYNYLTCNSGDMSITYKASSLDALKERVEELEDRVDDVETELASKTENSVVGTVESATTASQAYAVGEHFIRNDAFCTAIAAIASGATLTQGTNYVEGTIAECVARMGTYSTDEVEIGTWLGKKHYRKVINFGTLPNSTAKYVSANIGCEIVMTNLYGVAKDTYDWINLPTPTNTYGWAVLIGYKRINDPNHPDSVVVTTQQNYSVVTESYIVIEYTKNS